MVIYLLIIWHIYTYKYMVPAKPNYDLRGTTPVVGVVVAKHCVWDQVKKLSPISYLTCGNQVRFSS
jgi:hypothetical protein